MKVRKIPVQLISGIAIALCFGIALFIRVYFPYDHVFSNGLIKLTGNDAYYLMRLVDNLVHNFPRLISFDPYFIYPGGPGQGQIGIPPFFIWLLAGITWLIGLGSPTEHTVDLVGVYYPAVLAALSVIPVYFIGKELFGRWAGVISAALLAILPGEFLGRSILGFTDYHVAEMLFTTTAMLFLLLAIRTSQQSGLSINRLRDWANIRKPIIYSLLAGLFLGIYFITWIGALLFVFVISVYLVIQFIIEHMRRQSTDYLCVVGAIVFLVALVIYALVWHKPLHTVSLVIALLMPLALKGVSWVMTKREIRPAYYPLTLVGLGVVGLVIFWAVSPSLLRDMLSTFSIFTPKGVELTTMEMQPMLFPGGNFSLVLVWGNFTTGFFISLISLGILIYLVIKNGSAQKSLLLVWSLIILAAVLGQRRFAYYFAANVALLTGYASWELINLAVSKSKGFGSRITYINTALAVIVTVVIVFSFNIVPAITVAQRTSFAPPDAWCSSLTWLRENTPEPFGEPDFYYRLYEPPPPGEGYEYPESAYGILSWWDYGYLITRIAHRLPNTNPGSSPPSRAITAQFFTSSDEDSAQVIIEELDSSYIVIDHLTTTSKFHAVGEWAGIDKTQFYDYYYLPQENKLVGVILFYPQYYRSIVVRLYNFDGQAVIPRESIAMAYEDRLSPEGAPIKVVTDIQVLPSYEEATAFISKQKEGDYQIVGVTPFTSPVPLTALKQYNLIHGSDSIELKNFGISVPEVKIFEYIRD